MRLARLGLIGAVLLVALHAFLFASGDGHHGNPVPGSSIAAGSVQATPPPIVLGISRT